VLVAPLWRLRRRLRRLLRGLIAVRIFKNSHLLKSQLIALLLLLHHLIRLLVELAVGLHWYACWRRDSLV
jgi:hypothetical protein